MERTILNGSNLFDIFWKEAVHTIVHILNIVLIRTDSDKTPYELWKGRPTSVKYFKVFEKKCYIKRNEDNLGKFDSRTYEGFLLGYSYDKKSYRFYNLRLSKVVTRTDVIVYDEELSQVSKDSRHEEEYDYLEIEQQQDSQKEEMT